MNQSRTSGGEGSVRVPSSSVRSSGGQPRGHSWLSSVASMRGDRWVTPRMSTISSKARSGRSRPQATDSSSHSSVSPGWPSRSSRPSWVPTGPLSSALVTSGGSLASRSSSPRRMARWNRTMRASSCSGTSGPRRVRPNRSRSASGSAIPEAAVHSSTARACCGVARSRASMAASHPPGQPGGRPEPARPARPGRCAPAPAPPAAAPGVPHAAARAAAWPARAGREAARRSASLSAGPESMPRPASASPGGIQPAAPGSHPATASTCAGESVSAKQAGRRGYRCQPVVQAALGPGREGLGLPPQTGGGHHPGARQDHGQRMDGTGRVRPAAKSKIWKLALASGGSVPGRAPVT